MHKVFEKGKYFPAD